MSFAILIPASLRSTRLPDKNFMQFNGKKLIDWTIEFAKTLGYPIYVTTDWDEFKREGVTTIVRFFGSDADMRMVVDHAKSKIKEDNIVLLQCTSPLRKRETIKLCIEQFELVKQNIVTISPCTYKPDGRCYIFPKNKYIWDYPIYVVFPLPITRSWDIIDIDYIWDFRIAEAIQRGDYS